MSLLPGERVPDFRRLDARRRPVTLYQDYCSRQVLLVCLPGPCRLSQDERDRLAQLAGLSLLVLRQAEPGQLAVDDLPDAAVALADDGAVIEFLSTGSGSPFALLLDRNFRLLARFSLDEVGPEAVSQVLSDAEAVTTAPVLIVPRVLDSALCSELIASYQEDNEASGVMQMEGGRMVYAEDATVKIRREHRLTPGPLWQRLEDRMRRCLLPEIQWAFNYAVTRFEGVKVVCYDARDGGFFCAHRDNDGEDTAHRRFALTVNLNPDQYEGGELVFPEYGDRGYRPGAGSAVVFSCNLAHEARPVTKGRRYALVSFFFSEQESFQQAHYENRVRGR